jgi:hypothetical protein
MNLENKLGRILSQYHGSFSGKDYTEENQDHDVLMDVFGISPELKRENRQYWGRELGMCWQLLITEIFRLKGGSDFGKALRFGADEPCDLTFGADAIDTKYRVGSGDSGTLKKFKTYGALLKDKGYKPVFLILREDNLPAAISACLVGGWDVRTGEDSFKYIRDKVGFDAKSFLEAKINSYKINR